MSDEEPKAPPEHDPSTGQFNGKGRPPGRPKGAKNKRSAAVDEIMDRYGFDPIAARLEYRKLLLEQAEAMDKQISRGHRVGAQGRLYLLTDREILRIRREAFSLRRQADDVAAGLVDFRHARKKAVEHSGNVGVTWADLVRQEDGEPE